MDIEKLALLLKPWLRVDTWHTSHPSDEKRFHLALHSVFDELTLHISAEQFRNAIALCLSDCRPGDAKSFKAIIEELAQRGEYISSYLGDLKPY